MNYIEGCTNPLKQAVITYLKECSIEPLTEEQKEILDLDIDEEYFI